MAKRPLTAEELGKFQLDENNKLFWDDKPIKSENITLSTGQKFFAFLVAASAVLASFTTFNQEYCWIPYGNSCRPAADSKTAMPSQPDPPKDSTSLSNEKPPAGSAAQREPAPPSEAASKVP